MVTKNLYQTFTEAITLKKKLLAILVDPDKFRGNFLTKNGKRRPIGKGFPMG